MGFPPRPTDRNLKDERLAKEKEKPRKGFDIFGKNDK
jgi:hypothetical protein